jgi:hypothetical protein
MGLAPLNSNRRKVAATQVLGPNQTLSAGSPTIGVSAVGSNLTPSWPLASAGFTLLTRTNLASGNWTPVSSPVLQIVGSQWQVTVPVPGTAQYYCLQE